MEKFRFAVLTVSDSCSKDRSLDKSGPELERLVNGDDETGSILNGRVSRIEIVPDDFSAIEESLVRLADLEKVDVILTTGGTGLSMRDVTPEVTERVVEKQAPGLALAMMLASLKVTPMASLSRAICGVRGTTLIINLPGSPRACRECLVAIAPAIPHAIDLIKGDRKKIVETHRVVQEATPSQLQSQSPSQLQSHSCSHRHTEKPLELDNVATRSRESPYPMISVDEALRLMTMTATDPLNESIKVREALGRILSANVYSKYNLPPFRASIKDGYAVLADDGVGRRRVLCGVTAGVTANNIKLEPGTCVRVNTGAPVPDDATAVVQVEDTRLIKKSSDGKEEAEIVINGVVKKGQNIRPIGSDIREGELILLANQKLGHVELGLLEACGYQEVSVKELPGVGVLSTGDELQSPGTPLAPGHIYDSNKITLLSILKEQGLQPTDLGIARDNEESMTEKLEEALERCDVVITSGSVSMGDKDLMKPVLEHRFGARIHFGRVNMKPGKPTTFATCVFNGRAKYLLCLPGNPVSATVTMNLFVLPLLDKLRGEDCRPVIVTTRLTTTYDLDPRPEYARAILKWEDSDGIPRAYSTGNQISSKLLSCRQANALLLLPGRTKERPVLHPGDHVQAMLLGLKQYNTRQIDN